MNLPDEAIYTFLNYKDTCSVNSLNNKIKGVG